MGFSFFWVLKENVVDISMGVNGALGRWRGFHGLGAVALKAAGPLGSVSPEIIDDGMCVGDVVKSTGGGVRGLNYD